ncbi:pyridoxamine 5'-phosphate oxidase family protein [Cupriavidus taiwanensis]|uniref:pyridoxamine 5'-phosphate oxidase family protein n=1 Tax=Cupriavidus taiwanensis TaxID=164546 RepID=UPI000E10661E|nr:pyridoxamine 5'-phosphate oxidase family protein [Cupriavidus taiwanensis]SOY48477.1 putative 1 Pyridoxamine 5'-phosphate oxidase-related, FMN-binding protein [Cupriavidus taiwanensis]SOY48588.1 putative 1 Pyridoxamine 5'-phosphate oxidase-related, FMN-binding protein [Cupriavidus taiwanensis]SOY83118.1 putative 1 Pyridoxamine 5'-phosphate oxidase-related, FMN-binding protein [Cupriavidus taiwanensis]SOZ56382.1 putative 1 Pyridoxamine 5'-phosphate oxidase-related, FMN-binding protein [Cupria
MTPHAITTLAELEALYAQPAAPSLAKQVDYLHPHYRAFIEAAPFCLLSTVGQDWAECSPRGDAPGFVQVLDPRTLLLPDRRGNNRIDSLRNIVADTRVGLLFVIPGINETIRVNGTAQISVDPGLIARCVVDGKAPTTVLVITLQAVFFQCARALIRSRLWAADAQVARQTLPSNGEILATLSENAIDGAAYDRELPERQRATLY